MRAKELLGTLIFAIALETGAQPKGVFTGFSEAIQKAETDFSIQPSFQERKKRLDLLLKDLKTLRRNAPRGPESGEISMSLFLDSFVDFSLDAMKTPKDCEKRHHRFETMMKGRDPAQEDVMVSRADKLWRQMCSGT